MTSNRRIIFLSLCSILIMADARSDMIFTRERFDEMDRQIDKKRDPAHVSADDFAWSEAYVLRGYVEMYEATRDLDYLRRLVRVADGILDARDDRVAAREGRQARPLWRLGGKFTQARWVLKDAQGNDAIALRSIRGGHNGETIVSVRPGAAPGVFSLTTRNDYWLRNQKAGVTFEDLSLDPASPRYFERIINDPMYVAQAGFQRDPNSKPSTLLVAADVRKEKRPTDTLAEVKDVALVPGIVRYYGYIGPIFAPMTRFAKLVLDDPGLKAEFGVAAEKYLRAAEESMNAYEVCWRNGPGADEGYYLLIEKGAEFWCDGIMAPWNYMGATGQVMCNLWDWKHDPRWLDHLTRMAVFFKRDLKLMDNGAYSWPYWSWVGATGWKREQQLSVNTPEHPATPSADDISHAALEVEFAVMCWERGIVFTREDVARFAKTFMQNAWKPDRRCFALRVDGSREEAPANSVAAARWLELCAVDPAVFDACRGAWEAAGSKIGVYGHAVGSYARLYRWQEALKAAK